MVAGRFSGRAPHLGSLAFVAPATGAPRWVALGCMDLFDERMSGVAARQVFWLHEAVAPFTPQLHDTEAARTGWPATLR
jgi:hypothetical protein